MNKFLEILNKKILLCDGGMGSSIQTYSVSDKDFLGYKNLNEILSKTRPDIIEDIHSKFLEAGADIIETNTFGANEIVLKEFGLENEAYNLNLISAKLARNVADKFSTTEKPRFVAGSIGPGSKLPTLQHISFEELYENYKVCAKGLIDGGVDFMLIETCQDILQVKATVIAVRSQMNDMGVDLPVFVQVTMEETGTMLLGTNMESVVTTLNALGVDSVGINCATGPHEMKKYIEYLAGNWKGFISMQPNAGSPVLCDGKAVYEIKPQEFAEIVIDIAKSCRLNILGGCCGTTYEYTKAVADKLSEINKKELDINEDSIKFSSLYESVSVKQESSFFMIGERTNASGSKAFRQMLVDQDIDSISLLAKEQIKFGANMLDVNVTVAGRDEKADIEFVLTRLVKDSTVPIMIDSCSEEVIEKALKLIPGSPVINSINFESGEEKAGKICGLCKQFGAGVVGLAIDEAGMAKTVDEKLKIVERLIDFACNKYKLPEESVFIDPLTFTIATGKPEDRNLAKETLDAIELIHKKHPKVQILSGLSNVSFGLKGNIRKVLNSVFLAEAIKKGLTSAIAHAGNILPLNKIDDEVLNAAYSLIYNKEEDALYKYISLFEEKDNKKIDDFIEKKIEDKLVDMIIDGDAVNLTKILEEAKLQYSPIDIINKFLLQGMSKVGDMFGDGTMQLPFVLQSAEVMKKAVEYLKEYIDAKDINKKGSMVLATVEGDVHDIGKDLVDIIFSSNGYTVYNIGIKKTEQEILDAIEKYKPDIIGLSGLIVSSTIIMGKDLDVFEAKGINLPVLLGGAALNEDFVEKDLSKRYSGKVIYCKNVFSGLKALEELKE
jgi:5-methyltetrahydrofolate--homocysteine methyltransferase